MSSAIVHEGDTEFIYIVGNLLPSNPLRFMNELSRLHGYVRSVGVIRLCYESRTAPLLVDTCESGSAR